MSRIGWLIALQEENHRRLDRLFAPSRLLPGHYLSSVGDGLDLSVQVVENHRYTQELRFSYGLIDPQTGQPDPSAHLRQYRDAGLVEVTHCYLGNRWQDVLGMHPPVRRLLGHRLRMNTFLGKWIDLLAQQGHGIATLKPVPEAPQPIDLPAQS